MRMCVHMCVHARLCVCVNDYTRVSYVMISQSRRVFSCGYTMESFSQLATTFAIHFLVYIATTVNCSSTTGPDKYMSKLLTFV